MPTLTILHGREVVKVYPIGKFQLLIGRIADADIRLDNPIVSRRHAEIFLDGPTFAVHNLSDKNGTFINGQRIQEDHLLMNGDTIEIGKFTLRYDIKIEERQRLLQLHHMKQVSEVTGTHVKMDESVLTGELTAPSPDAPASPQHYESTLFLPPEEMNKVLQRTADKQRAHLEMITSSGRKLYPLQERTTIGKTENCDIQIKAGFMAPKQIAIIQNVPGVGIFLRADKGRVTVNGLKARGERKLVDGDLVEIEGIPFKFFDKLKL
jgi:hypothetical protein